MRSEARNGCLLLRVEQFNNDMTFYEVVLLRDILNHFSVGRLIYNNLPLIWGDEFLREEIKIWF